ncbi:glycerol-3-phosphate 1-O-acyltransferase PlsB [Elongatibacter sediminis]|uniref:Glycerol-3-phosphate acyltransferase n=1 Tax=Elongatibacter sediminis TaxID=3119006 RepID=A0AAW9RC72_9GAMM
MNTHPIKPGFLASLKLRWHQMLESILHTWVRTRVLPDPLADLDIDPERPVCYMLDSYALSSLLILDRVCRKHDMPRPLLPLQLDRGAIKRSYGVLKRKRGLIIQRTRPRTHSEILKHLLDRVCDGDQTDVQIVPVTILLGRAPDKETGIAKIFFSESWEIGGRLRRLFSTLVNGRNTFVRFSQPISLRQMADEGIGPGRTLRKISRILRVHFAQVRTAAIGPDLSHRRTVIDTILLSPTVEKAIDDHASANKVSVHKAWKRARAHAFEIAADYSYAFVRVASMALSWFWNRIYDGVDLHHFRDFQKIASDYEVIYVPCHRSHIDYLLVSYFIYHNGFVPPHVAAGVNLNLPGVGRFLRKGGAFFVRRTFRSQKLYAAVFNEYLSRILAQGTSIEYFVEGTRSRTGRLLSPKAGMLSMTVRGFLRSPVRPILFQPIYIGYERLVEGRSYTAELSGKAKKSESLGDLFKVFGVLRRKYGKVHVSFAEPVFLNDLLDKHEPSWKEGVNPDQRPAWLNPLIDRLGNQIMTGMNEAAHVNATNLLAVILLAAPKHALGRAELLTQLDLYLDLLRNCRYSDRVTFTDQSPDEIIDHGIELEFLQSREHPLGDIIEIKPDQAVLLTYFRNNISHLVALPSLIAASLLNARRVERERLRRIASALYPFLKHELYLPWDEAGFLRAMNGTIRWMKRQGLLLDNGDDDHLERTEGSTEEALQLQMLGRALLQTFERYFITIAVLAKNGSGSLTRAQLERLCILTAQRISLLSEFDAPEFYDRSLFRQFIELLKQRDVLVTGPEGRLEFDDTIESITEDAKTLLSKDIRHGIIRVAPQVLQKADTD